MANNGAIQLRANTGTITINSGADSTPSGLRAGAGHIELDAETIALRSTIISALDQLFNGAVTLEDNVTLESEHAGTISFNETIDSDQTPRSLTISTTGETQFNGAVGSNFQLGQLTTNGLTVINTDQIHTQGSQTFNGPIKLASSTTLTGTTITFNGTIDSEVGELNDLTLNSEQSGITSFNGSIGQNDRLGNLTTNSDGSLVINAPIINTHGHQIFNEIATVGVDSTLNAAEITFDRSLNNQGNLPHNLVLNTLTGAITLGGDVGTTTVFNTVTFSADQGIVINGDLATISDLSLTSINDSIAAKNLSTQGGNVVLQAGIENTPLTLAAGIQAGDVQLSSLTTQGGSITINAQRFFRATGLTADGSSLSTRGTLGSGDDSITIVHGGFDLSQPFVVGSLSQSNNGTVGFIRSNSSTVLTTQAFFGSVQSKNITILSGDNNPSMSSDFLSPDVIASLSSPVTTSLTQLERIEDLNTAEFSDAFGVAPVRQSTPEQVQALLQHINNSNDDFSYQTFATAYLYYTRTNSNNSSNQFGQTTGQNNAQNRILTNQGRVLRPDEPPLSRDSLSILLVTQDGLIQVPLSPEINREFITQKIQDLREGIQRPDRGLAYQPHAIALYNAIIEPIKTVLNDTPVDNLMFVLGRGLRSIPLAALYDQENQQFLVEQYGLALVPSLSYLDDRPATLKNAQAIAMGSAEFKNNQNQPLPSVPTELQLVGDTRPTQILQGEQFTFENFTHALQQRQRQQRNRENPEPLILHMATHADFGSQPIINRGNFNLSQFPSILTSEALMASLRGRTQSTAYLQFVDRQLRLNEIQEIRFNRNINVELFVISACNTATGNDEAELGFAGLSLQMGAQSTIASLWQVSDVGTMNLMGELYDQLNKQPNRISALRAAQLAMIRGESGYFQNNELHFSGRSIMIDPQLESNILKTINSPTNSLGDLNFSHPYYWSAFTLIGSPW